MEIACALMPSVPRITDFCMAVYPCLGSVLCIAGKSRCAAHVMIWSSMQKCRNIGGGHANHFYLLTLFNNSCEEHKF